MGWFSTDSTAANSGGGGGTTYAWRTDTFEQSAAWTAGDLVLSLGFTPADPDSVILNFQNGNLFNGVDYTISGSAITIQFAYDPVDVGLTSVAFQAQYPYIP